MLFSARNNQKTNWVLSALVLYCGGVAAVRAEELARKSSTYPAKIVAGPVQPSGPRAAGLTITPIYDTTITSDPRAADIKAAIEADLALYQNLYSDSVTVRIITAFTICLT